MKRLILVHWRFVASLFLVCFVAAAIGVWQRESICCWHYLRGLDAANESDRKSWVECVVSLDAAAVPGLLARFRGPHEKQCRNAAAALVVLARRWGSDDARLVVLVKKIDDDFNNFSLSGKEAALGWQAAVLQLSTPADEQLRRLAYELLEKAASQPGTGVRLQVLALADLLAETNPPPKCRLLCQELLMRELKNARADIRRRAVLLALRKTFQDDGELLKKIAPLLQDNDPQVRRAAVLAVGTAREVVRDEKIMPLLHDPDKKVRRLCAVALRSRGLDDEQIMLGRLFFDRRPETRLQVVHHLPRAKHIDAGIWLDRLSRDSSPAVRAAATRLSASYPEVKFRARLANMAANDTSETVRQLARYYLTRN